MAGFQHVYPDVVGCPLCASNYQNYPPLFDLVLYGLALSSLAMSEDAFSDSLAT